MRLTYLDGTKGDDDLYDQPLSVQHAYVARCMNITPDSEYWSLPELDRLLALRRLKGRSAFYREIGLMLTPGQGSP